MNKFQISNHTFDRWGTRFRHLIDPDHFLGRSALDLPYSRDRFPLTNIRKKPTAYEMELLVPGFRKEDIEVTLENNILEVKGKRVNWEEDQSDMIVEEFDIDSFTRRFRLNPELSSTDIHAAYESGILRISFYTTNTEEAVKRSIEIEENV